MLQYHRWLGLPIETRRKLAQTFNIPKTGATEVFNNTVKADGYAIKDLEKAFTVENVQKYLNTSEKDIIVLWNYLVDKAEGKQIEILDIGKVEIVPSIVSDINPAVAKEVSVPAPVHTITPPKPRGRPKKNA